jgi:hypothetical protein
MGDASFGAGQVSLKVRLAFRSRADCFHAYPVVTHSHNMWGVANLPSRVLRKSVR